MDTGHPHVRPVGARFDHGAGAWRNRMCDTIHADLAVGVERRRLEPSKSIKYDHIISERSGTGPGQPIEQSTRARRREL